MSVFLSLITSFPFLCQSWRFPRLLKACFRITDRVFVDSSCTRSFVFRLGGLFASAFSTRDKGRVSEPATFREGEERGEGAL